MRFLITFSQLSHSHRPLTLSHSLTHTNITDLNVAIRSIWFDTYSLDYPSYSLGINLAKYSQHHLFLCYAQPQLGHVNAYGPAGLANHLSPKFSERIHGVEHMSHSE